MKKKGANKPAKKIEFDVDLLRRWKKVNTHGKLQWLSDALYFGKMKKF